ncbi:MAG: type I secretion system permease/ATPase [Roseovarius sp.]
MSHPSHDLPIPIGRAELCRARDASRALYWWVGLFGVFTNLLLLSGPLYMLQVYDRVLSSHSVETLAALSALVLFLYVVMGLLDPARMRIMARIGARLYTALAPRVFRAAFAGAPRHSGASDGLAHLDHLQRALASPVAMALFDLPWTPLLLAGICIFHPWLGALAIAGGCSLILLLALNKRVMRGALGEAGVAQARAESLSRQLAGQPELMQSMGLGDRVFALWQRQRWHALEREMRALDTETGFLAATKTLRFILQSAMLGLGALLVLRQELTPGAMIASSILLGRALAPVEQLVGQWSVVQRAIVAWRVLGELLEAVPPERPRTALPTPKAHLQVRRLCVQPPGVPVPLLRDISFVLDPGEALGVIGPSGAGKSTLARVIAGIWPPASGEVLLDGVPLQHYGADILGESIGYLPQKVELLDGSIASNIARFDPVPDAAEVVAAARMAGAHEMILSLPGGYDTEISTAGPHLSGGQVQRVGLARALYGRPELLVLDEPNANLDDAGSAALNGAVRTFKRSGGAVLVIAHRPAAIRECERLLVLDAGRMRAFGPTQEVLTQSVENHAELAAANRREARG